MVHIPDNCNAEVQVAVRDTDNLDQDHSKIEEYSNPQIINYSSDENHVELDYDGMNNRLDHDHSSP